MSKSQIVVYWVRRDFRLDDNPALFEAIEHSHKNNIPFLPLYCVDKGYIDNPEFNVSYPRKHMLYSCLRDFGHIFEQFLITQKDPQFVFEELSETFKVTVFCNDDIEPFARQRDKKVQDIVLLNGGKFCRLGEIMSIDLSTRSQSGSIYTVFTPFKNAVWDSFVNCRLTPTPDLNDASKLTAKQTSQIVSTTQGFFVDTSSNDLKELQWLLEPKWTCLLPQGEELEITKYYKLLDLSQWVTNEHEVVLNAKQFVAERVNTYKENRDSLPVDGTSKLSYALKWGLISSRGIMGIINEGADLESNINAQSYVSELIWREFYKYILYHFPYVLDNEFMAKRRDLEWVTGQEAIRRFESWIQGNTGFEVVDAGMRQIASTGWMHNRTRMITASVLTKNLGIDWRWGQAYFRAALIDLDEASNNGGWQWSASVGVDPKPIRIFNPYTQKQKFDPNGVYCDRWLGDKRIDNPVVDYKQTRQQALKRYGLE